VCSDSSADSVIRSRAALISGRLLSSADAFTAIDKSCKHQYTISIVKLPVTYCSTTLSIEDFLL
jgi:26S proteasome non-ATPase regulatory subunit 5